MLLLTLVDNASDHVVLVAANDYPTGGYSVPFVHQANSQQIGFNFSLILFFFLCGDPRGK